MKRKTFAVDIDGTITENGGGLINLEALASLRYLVSLGHNVIFVSGRSSVEGYLLSVYGGTTKIAVGENGGCITQGPNDHILLGDINICEHAYNIIRSEIKNVIKKPVFPRKTEVVLERTFDIDAAKNLVEEKSLDVTLSDSQYAIHINSHNINKGRGFEHVMKMYSISKKDVIAIGDSETDVPLFEVANTSVALGNASEYVKSKSTIVVQGKAGDGVIEALDQLLPQITG